MRNNKRRAKRIVALIASIVLVVGLMPAQALAEAATELTGQTQAVGIETVASVDPAPAIDTEKTAPDVPAEEGISSSGGSAEPAPPSGVTVADQPAPASGDNAQGGEDAGMGQPANTAGEVADSSNAEKGKTAPLAASVLAVKSVRNNEDAAGNDGSSNAASTSGSNKPGYTVTFDANVPANASTARTGNMEDQSFAYDEKKSLSANGYALPGYEFVGWNTKADGTTTAKTEVVLSGAFPANVPEGMIVSEGFTGGMWDADPGSAVIVNATAFTYTFDAEQEVHGVVEWNDDDNESGERPEKVTVRLMANGAESSSMEVAEGAYGLWAFSFDKLSPRDPQGNEIAYSVTADEVPEYTVEVVHVDGSACRITYTRPTPVKPTLTITAKDQKYTYNGQTQGEGDTAYEDPAQIAEKVTVEGLLEGDELTSVVLDGQGQEVGDYLIEVTGFSINNNPGARDKYDVVLVPGTLTIKPADPAKYMVTFADDDGTVISSESYAEGTAAADIKVPADPAKPPTAQCTYTFAGWSPEIADVTGDATYTATYTSTVRKYTVTWKDDDGSVIDTTQVEYGMTPSHADPVKPADAEHTYAFAGWTPEVVAVTGGATYTATYDATPIPPAPVKATLTFDLGGGTLDGKTGKLTIEANVGDTIKLPAAPKREGYTFKYWKGSQYAAGADYKVEGDHAFTAVWEKSESSGSGDSGKKSPLPATGDDNAAALTLCALMALASLVLLSGSAALRRRGTAYKGKHSSR